ncbi:AAA family ATPase [bacterium]|nr:AAA family ATPase [bacterium]
MMISRIKLKNWRNFGEVDVPLGRRAFLIGPNASGKSNFLDAFRFLRDVAKSEGGGLQKAVADRGGLSKIRCLAARRHSDVMIEVHLSREESQEPLWKYAISIRQERGGTNPLILAHERVWNEEEGQILNRPDKNDLKDRARLGQTFLEQINANQKFRDIARFFESVKYMHLVPQLIRHPETFAGRVIEEDPFGQRFLEDILQTNGKVRDSRLRRIQEALACAVPQFEKLSIVRDERGIAHLEIIYNHWRAKGAKQNEEQFSDGTLRLIGLLWSILACDSVLLLEEPELSLHTAIIRQLLALMWRMQQKRKGQLIISTHSYDLLSDKGIGGEETLLLTPGEGTRVEQASRNKVILAMLESGMSIADAALPVTEPENIRQLSLFNV